MILSGQKGILGKRSKRSLSFPFLQLSYIVIFYITIYHIVYGAVVYSLSKLS